MLQSARACAKHEKRPCANTRAFLQRRERRLADYAGPIRPITVWRSWLAVVMLLLFAWKARCAAIIFVNSSAIETFDSSSEPATIEPAEPVPAVWSCGSPEFAEAA